MQKVKSNKIITNVIIRSAEMVKFEFHKEKILNYIIANKLSKKQFCLLCNIDISCLNRILSGNVNIYLRNVVKICKTIHIKISELYTITKL